MFTRGIVVIVLATAIAVGLLGIRQQRLTTMHDMARLRDKMDGSRKSTWDMQVRIAGRIDPPKLAKAIERAKLQLEPATPGAAAAMSLSANPANRNQLSAVRSSHGTDD